MKLSRRQILIASGLLPLLESGKSAGMIPQNDSEKAKSMNEKKEIYDCVIVGGGHCRAISELLSPSDFNSRI